jgi:hypothetical protein
MVTAVGAGDAVITVTTRDGNKTAFCFITVLEAAAPLIPVTGVTVSSSVSPNANQRYDVHVNSGLQFVATVAPADASQKEVIWESSDSSVAAVGASGFINALKVGTATITVTTAGTKADGEPATASFYVYVYADQSWIPPEGYLNTPLAPHDPVAFYGTYVMYMNEYISLGPKTIYIDGTLSDEIVAQYDYVYNDFMTAVDSGALVNGTGENDRMRVLIAPWVYWCDSLGRDNPAIAASGVGTGLYGMVFSCNWLSFEGLTQDPYNVILCGNRGQQAGSNGNWTLFSISSSGEFYVENLTIANYACFDLEYPLNPSLNVPKRTTAMTQSQLVGSVGSRVFAKNSNFISRLNLMPPSATRTLYVDCHFESTDDSIPGGTGVVYLNCDLDFFSNRPAGGIGGVTFLNCTFNSHIGYNDTTGQLISKGDGNGAIIDGRFIHPNPNYDKVGWTLSPAATRRNYQYNVTMNGKPILMSADKPGVSVRLEEHPRLLKAYKFTYNGETVYNTYNILRGTDDWDPMKIKDKVRQASALDPEGLDYGALPRFMTASASPTSLTYSATPPSSNTNFSVTTINTNTDTSVATVFGNLQWAIVSGEEGGTLSAHSDPNRAVVTAGNLGYTNIPVIVEAVSPYGLHAAVQITSIPAQIAAPTFTSGPTISYANGKLTLDYTYNVPDPNIVDHSVINWYRAEDASGTNRVPVMVSRLNEPEPVYTPAPGDVGSYIIAEITPKYQISPSGTMASASYASVITSAQVAKPKEFNINFQNFPSAYQNAVKAGFWTIDYWRPWRGYQPAEYDRSSTQVTATISAQGTGAPWTYATGTAGMLGIYGYKNQRLARLMYTPTAGTYKDMSIVLEVATEKAAAQGFGSAAQYMDFIIKFDSATNSGYGLRIERIGASGSATVINLVKYDNVEYLGTDIPETWPAGEAAAALAATPRITYLTTTGSHAMGSASNLVKVYDTFCTIELKVVGSTLSAKVSRAWESRSGQVKEGNDSYQPVELTVTLPEIGASNFGGIMFNDTGTSGENSTGLRYLDIVWQ